jgi:hypothetical protein
MGLPCNLRLGGRMHSESRTSLLSSLSTGSVLPDSYAMLSLSTLAHCRNLYSISDATVDSFTHCVTTESITTCQIHMVER